MNVLSLFTGIGGLDLAAEWAGMQTVAFCERDPWCQKLLAKRWPGIPCFDDVTTLKGSDIGQPVDLITGGFPCQPYSLAGRKLGASDDRHLWPEYRRLIKELWPTWVVGENVVGIINLALDDVLADLESLGYTCRTFDIPAAAVGASHERRRVIIVAHAERKRQPGPRPCRPSLDQAPDSYREASGLINAFRTGALPYVCRSHDGVSDGMDRLRALGNAVDPGQVFPVFKAIADIEYMTAR